MFGDFWTCNTFTIFRYVVQAVLVAYHRARQWPEHGLSGGLMAATGLSAPAAAERLEREALTSCVVACDNSPTSITLSGDFIACYFAY